MIVLTYLMCGVLFMIVRAIGAALVRHYVRALPEADFSIAAYLFDLALWPVSFIVWLVAWFMICGKTFSAYRTARRLRG